LPDPSSQTLGGTAPDPAEPPDPLLGRTLAGKYKLEKKLGEGGMGAVYKARQLALEKTIAVKVMHAQLASDPMFAARFHREAKAASRLDHVNSIGILDYGEEPDGLLYIAMEFLDGRDLLHILDQEAPLPAGRIVDILSQALSALAVAHDMGIIHRDLKPENIMVLRRKGEDERVHDVVKVCDFGIAKVADTVEDDTVPADQKKKNSKLTTAGLVIGTPEYMSPEQGRGEPLDARCDLYSMGVILYLLLSGQTPFDAPTPLGIVLKHQSEEPLPPSRYRPEADLRLEAVCLKAMSKKPADRYATAREMRLALRAVVDGTISDGMVPLTRTPSGNIAHARTEAFVPPPTQVVQSGGFHLPNETAGLAPLPAGEVARAATAPLATPTGTTPTSPPSSRVALVAGAAVLALGVLAGVAYYGWTALEGGSPPTPSAVAKSSPPPPSPHSASVPAPPPPNPPPSAAPKHDLVPPAPVTSLATSHPKSGPPLGSTVNRAPLGEAVNATPTPPPPVPSAEAPVAPPPPPPQVALPQAPAPPATFDRKGAHVLAGAASVMGGGAHERAVNRVVNSTLDAMTSCYQTSLTPTTPEGSWNLHLTTDDVGNMVDVSLDGPLPAKVKGCIQQAMMRSTVPSDTGALNATVLLTFKLK